MAFKCQRWTVLNILPVAFVLSIISIIWTVHVFLHLRPLLNSSAGDERQRGLVETIVTQVFTFLVLVCYSRAVFTDPGSVPDAAEWRQSSADAPKTNWSKDVVSALAQSKSSSAAQAQAQAQVSCSELKYSGGRRFCKWCNCYKPDRCHHCRACKSCVLRMDHHCPWIGNCVGFRNHKFFMLLVVYSLVTCILIGISFAERLSQVFDREMSATGRFFLVFGMTLCVVMGILLMLFLLFHIRLMVRAMTTIEFCERRHKPSMGKTNVYRSPYDRGMYENMQNVLGTNPLLWFLPVAPPPGDGLSFRRAGADEGDGHESTSLLLGKDRSSEQEAGCDADDPSLPEITGQKSVFSN